METTENIISNLGKVWNAFNNMEHELYADYVFDALELLKEQQPKWIPVKEQLPEEKENPVTHDFCEVICYCQFGGVPRADDVRVFKFGNGHFYHGLQIMDGIVTHWQYLPEPPKEGEQDEL